MCILHERVQHIENPNLAINDLEVDHSDELLSYPGIPVVSGTCQILQENIEIYPKMSYYL